MSLIGNNWKEEPSSEEIYKDITGIDFYGSKKDLEKEIEKQIESSYTSKTSRNLLRDLLNELNK